MKKVLKCFPEGKFKVLTLSYDDGTISDRRMIECLNEYKIKATFHINSGLTSEEGKISKDELRLSYKGHEVACHTVDHFALDRCSTEMIISQIMEDRRSLERLLGLTVRGFSYPYGAYNSKIKEILKTTGIEYARVAGGTGSFDMPHDFLEWRPTCHHRNFVVKHAEAFLKIERSQFLSMMYVWGHSIDFEKENNWNLLHDFCSVISGKEDIWYATNIEIVDYMNALNNLKFSIDNDFVYNPSVIPVWISVDNEIMKVGGGVQKQLFV